MIINSRPRERPDEVNPDQGDTVNPVTPPEFPPGREDVDEPAPPQPDIAPPPPETPPPETPAPETPAPETAAPAGDDEV